MDVLSTSQAAEALGVTQRRVLAMITARRLPATRVGNSYIIQRADLAKVKDRKPGRPPAKKTRGKKSK
jgi:excisionase family DNA binding protein